VEGTVVADVQIVRLMCLAAKDSSNRLVAGCFRNLRQESSMKEQIARCGKDTESLN